MRRCHREIGGRKPQHEAPGDKKAGTALPTRDAVKTIIMAFPDLSKSGTDPGADMTIYQAGTNDAPRNSIVIFFRTFIRGLAIRFWQVLGEP